MKVEVFFRGHELHQDLESRRQMGSTLPQTNMAGWKITIFNIKYIYKLKSGSFSIENLSVCWSVASFFFFGGAQIPNLDPGLFC